MLNIHTTSLPACTAEPLAFYLKSLAILRLVVEQADAAAKGCWRNGVFQVQSSLDPTGLVKFLVDDYVPTPIVAPWNGGSGFYEGDSTDAIDAIRNTENPRFREYRGTIEAILAWPELPPVNLRIGAMLDQLKAATGDRPGKANEGMRRLVRQAEEIAATLGSPAKVLHATIAEMQGQTRVARDASREQKAEAAQIRTFLQPVKKIRTCVKKLHRAAGKNEMVQACRNRLSERVLEWVDAAIIMKSDQELGYPPLLGTGGSEGRLDYTNAFMSCLVSLLLFPENRSNAEALLRNALFGDPAGELMVASFGQFHPGRAGGFNQGAAIETKEFPINPWDFVLAVEGAIVWAAGLSRRRAAGATTSLSVPFTVRAKPVGFLSAAAKDSSASRCETWAPLWPRPAGYAEVRALFAEGRADLGRRSASDSIEFAEAATSLGVARGISQFVRYSLIKRRGDSYVALPAGRFPVQQRSESDLVRQLDPLLERVDRFLRNFKSAPPARFSSARRGIDEAIYEVLLRGGSTRVKQLLAAIGRLERLFAERDLAKKPKLVAPLGGLRPEWIVAADDGSIEIRIAASLASIAPTGAVGPLRANFCPVDPRRPYTWAKGKGQTAWNGRSLAARLAATLERRMMDASRTGCPSNPLWGSLPVLAEDALALAEGDLEESLVEDLLFGLSWVDFRSVREVSESLRNRWCVPVKSRIIPRTWALLKLLFLPGGVPTPGGEVDVRPEPSILGLLRAGRIGDACLVASRRLYMAGLVPTRARFPNQADGIRTAATLLVPVRDVRKIAKQVLNVTSETL